MSQRKIWSKSEKLAILDYSEKHIVLAASRKFGISTTSIYKWKDKLNEKGVSSLEPQKEPARNAEQIRLERENRELKAIVAEKELQIRIQAEMLKKSR